MLRIFVRLLATALWLVPAALPAQEAVDLDAVNRIRNEEFHRSQVMEIIAHLTDVIGPRLTGSPQLATANAWTRDQLTAWGLANAHLEPWSPFGKGWSFSRSEVVLLQPVPVVLRAVPKAWSAGTNGPVEGEVMRVDIKTEKDFDTYRGKLAGKILLLDKASSVDFKGSGSRRYTAEQLAELGEFQAPNERTAEERREGLDRFRLRRALRKFFADEKALATIESSTRDWGIIQVTGTNAFRADDDPGVPSLVMEAEAYDRVVRLAESGKGDRAVMEKDKKDPVRLSVDLAAKFIDGQGTAYNTIAEIPGTDKKDEVVMLGAHLDSWHAGTGATDNAAGCAVVMEAVRLLKTLGFKPRRTIRIALWTGEEQGLLGSTAYVSEHFASRPEPKDPAERDVPAFLRRDLGPLTVKPEHAKLAAYFNLDNGSGKIRGIYAQENSAVVPIFKAWLAPFADLGADTVTARTTGSTDHVPFARVGLPGFQFIQDQLDYSPKTHHTNLDVYDHLERKDLMQASILMAAFVYDAAMRPEKLPRLPLPKPPAETPAP